MSLKKEFPEGNLRQKQRLENKKRKAQAFLDLIKDDKGQPERQSETNENEKQDERTSFHSENKQPPEKKIKIIDVTVKKPGEDGMNREDKDVLLEMKKVLRERQKASMQRPKIFLTLDELTRDAPMENPDEVKETPPLLMMDVQHLLLFALLNTKMMGPHPRWCRLLRVGKVSKVVALVLDSVSSEEFNAYPDSLPTLKQAFDVNADIIPPAKYGSSVREDLLNVQVTVNQLRMKIEKQTGEEKKALEKQLKVLLDEKNRMKEQRRSMSGSTKEAGHQNTEESNGQSGTLDRRSLMLNSSQILHENIPLPFDVQKKYMGFVFTKDKYAEVTRSSPLFGIDCEMVQSTASQMDLARVSIVNEHLETVYDTYVKPRARIKDYVTKFSGITKEIMDSCNTYLEDVQKHIQKILPADAILCGQSIGGDLRSLKMFHPYLIDTSVIFNLTGKRRMKTGLKRLAAHFLGEDIQNSKDGHSSVEDASSTMQLVKLKLQNDIEFGDLAWEFTGPQLLSRPAPASPQHSKHETIGIRDKANDMVTGLAVNGQLIQHKLFFQHSRYTEFFFNRIRESDKKGLGLDDLSTEKLYPESEDLKFLENDKQRQKQTVTCLEERDFCLTNFYAYRDMLSSCDKEEEDCVEKKKKCLLKLDKRVGKIMTKIPANSLLVVILSGQNANQENSSKVFCKIT